MYLKSLIPTCICRSLGSLSVLFGQVVKGLSSGSRVFQYIASPLSSPLRGGHTLPAEEVKGRVEFRDVQFSYPNRPNQVLRPPPPLPPTHTHTHTLHFVPLPLNRGRENHAYSV